jgi:hypothetical protein
VSLISAQISFKNHGSGGVNRLAVQLLSVLGVVQMKTLFVWIVLVGVACGQSAMQTDHAAVHAAINKAIADAGVPAKRPPPEDPVLTLIKANATIYAALQACVNASGTGGVICQLEAVLYSCPKPAQWKPSTSYLFGAFVSDSAGNVYQLTLITPLANGSAVSGSAVNWNSTAVGAVTIDGPYTWTMFNTNAIPNGICSVGAQ